MPDGDGELIYLTDGNYKTTTYNYDSLGQIQTESQHNESEHDNRGRSDHDNRWSVRDLMRGMSTGGLLSGSFRDALLPKATRGTILHQRRIQGTSRPSLPQRSMAA